MVNFRDPATIAKESGAHAFPSGFRNWQPDSLVGLFNSGSRKALAPCGWHIHVSRCVLPSVYRLSTPLLNRDPPLLAGSSSPPLTLSGMSFEGVAPTDGRYGFVTFFWVSSPPTHNRGSAIGLLYCARGHPIGPSSQHGRL
jgi:hypothetical protein